MECAHVTRSSIHTQTFLGLSHRWHLFSKDIICFTLGLSSQRQTECFHQCVALAAMQPHLCLSPPDTAGAAQEPILKAEAQRWQHCGSGAAALNEITGCEGRERVAKSSRTIKRKVISLQLSAQLRCRERFAQVLVIVYSKNEESEEAGKTLFVYICCTLVARILTCTLLKAHVGLSSSLIWHLFPLCATLLLFCTDSEEEKVVEVSEATPSASFQHRQQWKQTSVDLRTGPHFHDIHGYMTAV